MSKKIIFSIILFACFCSLAHSQARKPTIMVVPNEGWCIRNKHFSTFDNQGTKEQVPDYKKALQDPQMRVMITKMAGLMASYDFPMVSLEAEMRKLENEAAEVSLLTGSETGTAIAESPIERLNRQANADILIDISYDVKTTGPNKQVVFNVTAYDAYTSKIISGNTGTSDQSARVPVETLLEQSVLNYIHNFTADLQRHFDDTFANGREIRVVLRRFDACPFNFETDFVYNGQVAELAEIIEVWFEDNCVQGRFSMAQRSTNLLRFDQVRMPLYGRSLSGRETAIDARGFVRSLQTMLQSDPYNLPVKIYPKGLGEVWLILGEK